MVARFHAQQPGTCSGRSDRMLSGLPLLCDLRRRGLTEEDRRQIRRAIDIAKRRNAALSESTFDFLASVLLLEHPDGSGRSRARANAWTSRCTFNS